MYMETRAHMNYWSTENFCGRWSLRTGTLIIATVTTVWSVVCLCWAVAVLCLQCVYSNTMCWFMPGPEVETISKMVDSNITTLAKEEALRLAVISVSVYHGVYLLFSIMVFIGVFKKLPTLLSGWIGITNVHMVLVLADLLLTLAFTTLVHLLITLAHFVATLCAWVVVKSHRQRLRVMRTKPPIPDHALLDYTVDGVDKIALDPAP